jgi:hypothetical protein
VAKEVPRTLSAELAEELIGEARSVRDKAILVLLSGGLVRRTVFIDSRQFN